MLGYADPEYAASLVEWGAPTRLFACDGWVLDRPIPRNDDHDAMGCYPLFSCRQWDGLAADLWEHRNDWVALSLVTDPFGAFDESLLRDTFDRVIAFKEHFVADLSRPMERFVSAHNRKRARRGLRLVQVDVPANPAECLDEWVSLYDVLTHRHGITGIRRFSRAAFASQLGLVGVTVLRARVGAQVVGMQIWLQRGDVMFTHLAAYSELGYESWASYALHWSATEYFRSRVAWLSLGGGAAQGNDGLADFKRGWSTGSRQVYLCGKVLQPTRYAALVAARGVADSDYFPLYRDGEF